MLEYQSIKMNDFLLAKGNLEKNFLVEKLQNFGVGANCIKVNLVIKVNRQPKKRI